MELLDELRVRLEQGVSERSRARLATVKGANKLAKLAKALGKLPSSTEHALVDGAIVALIRSRIESVPEAQSGLERKESQPLLVLKRLC